MELKKRKKGGAEREKRWLNQKRIKQKKEEERVAELKLKNVWAETEKRLGFLGYVRLQQVKGWTLKT